MAGRSPGEVVSRDRFSRLFSLGDRNKPQSWAPGLILSDLDQNLPLEIAPFSFKRDSSKLPSKLTLHTRGNLCYPFDGLDVWQSSEGLVLPPASPLQIPESLAMELNSYPFPGNLYTTIFHW